VTGEAAPPESPRPATPEVNASLRAQLEQLLGEYDRARGHLAAMQRKMREARGEATSKDRSVTVTVGARGNLITLRIEPRAYRQFSPSELATEITSLAQKATELVAQEFAGVVAPFLPQGVSYADLLSGQANAAAWDTAAQLAGATLRDWWSLTRQSPHPESSGPSADVSAPRRTTNEAKQ
jgi:DNA-binding protein YbaB